MTCKFDEKDILPLLTAEEDQQLHKAYITARNAFYRRVNQLIVNECNAYESARVQNPFHPQSKFQTEHPSVAKENDVVEKPVTALYKKLCLKYHPDTSAVPNAEEIFKQIQCFYNEQRYDQLETLWATGTFKDEMEIVEIDARSNLLLFDPFYEDFMVTPEELVILEKSAGGSADMQMECVIERIRAVEKLPDSMMKSKHLAFLRKSNTKTQTYLAIDEMVAEAKAKNPQFTDAHEYVLYDQFSPNQAIHAEMKKNQNSIVYLWRFRLQSMELVKKRDENRVFISLTELSLRFECFYNFDCIICAIDKGDIKKNEIDYFMHRFIAHFPAFNYFKCANPAVDVTAAKADIEFFTNAEPLIDILKQMDLYSDNPLLHFYFWKLEMRLKVTSSEMERLASFLLWHPDIRRVLINESQAQHCSELFTKFPQITFFIAE